MKRSDGVVRHSNWGLRLGLSWMLPKRSMIDETIRFGRAESAMMDSVRMPSLRVSDPVAIVGLEIERAQRDWVSRQDLIRTERSDTMSTTIHFDVGSSDIRADAIAPLEATLDLLRAVPGLRIRIEGQPDVRGSTADNITLGWQRATAAKLWLTNRGITPDRIQTIGFGEGRPLCDSNEESCKWQNRDEFVIIAGADADLRGRQ